MIKECDMCGLQAYNSKRGTIIIHSNEVTRYVPQKQLFQLCNRCYEIFNPNDYHIEYEYCSDELKKWFDR